ncbi:MAG: Hsp33 family molecular chaperone HslO, partial [Lachnospiraceae bacterium]|nr:Hsp33 family molecular chaperone HslO [Lachnospiraceae bacterium]
MKDYIVRATAANAQIRAFAINSRELVEQARSIHLSPSAAAAAYASVEVGGGR